MLLKPEIYKFWEEALKRFEDAQKLSKEGKLQEAANEAGWAVVFGWLAVRGLSEELKMPDLSAMASSVYRELFEREEKHYTPKEKLEWADKAFKRLSAEIPPDILRPLR